jgi:N-acetylmuramoyl-L-alanine amidase
VRSVGTSRSASPASSPSRSPARSPAQPDRPLAGTVVVIDPGHNGGDAAAPAVLHRLVNAVTEWKPCETAGTETVSGYTEATFNFDVATRLAALLRAKGARVVLTRTSNDGAGPCFSERAAIANRLAADVALSIHADGGPVDGHGFHVIAPADVGVNHAIVEPSRRLALLVRAAYADGTGEAYATYLGHGEGLMVRSDLGGLNLSRVPKVLVECANMRNPADARRLEDAAFRQRAAAALAVGLERFLAAQRTQ